MHQRVGCDAIRHVALGEVCVCSTGDHRCVKLPDLREITVSVEMLNTKAEAIVSRCLKSGRNIGAVHKSDADHYVVVFLEKRRIDVLCCIVCSDRSDRSQCSQCPFQGVATAYRPKCGFAYSDSAAMLPPNSGLGRISVWLS